MSSAVFFIATFLAIYILVRQYSAVRVLISRFGEYLQLRAFPRHSNFEHFKFAVLRPLFGIILLSRAFNIHSYLTSEDLASAVGIWSISGLVAAVLLTVGLFTQYSLLFLAFLMWQHGDTVMGTATLGNDVGAMLAVLLFLTGAGRHLSIDAIIVNRFRLAEKFLLYTKAYSDPNNIALAKFSALASYWAICVYSVSMHFNESAWMTGVAAPLLLTNNFMSSPYLFFESLFISNEIAVYISKLSLWSMMLWYPAILPLTLMGGWWRNYAIVWGLLFLLFCLLILNLGSLVEIEFVFWAAIFWSKTGLSSSEKLSVFYDDKCNLCDKTVQIISALDIFGRIKLKPISENIHTLTELKINLDDALNDLYGVSAHSGEICSGYNFYILLSRKVFLLWPVFPILLLGKWLAVGPIIYSAIATRRCRLFGICSIPRQKTIRHALLSPTIQQNFNSTVVIHVTFLIVCYLIFIPAPYIGISGARNASTKAAHYYGITPINVFNKTDLRMAENWFTLKSLDYEEIVPVFTEKGTRLQMHKSDRIYFGKTVRYRRGSIGKSGCISKPKILDYLAKVYLSKKQVQEGEYHFMYKQYYQALPDFNALSQGKYKKNKIEVRCDFEYQVSYKS